MPASFIGILIFLPFLKVTIRLAPVLPTTVAVVHFPNVQKATEAVADVMNTGVGIRMSSTLHYHETQTEIYFAKT